MLAIVSLSSYEKFANKRQHRDVNGLKTCAKRNFRKNLIFVPTIKR